MVKVTQIQMDYLKGTVGETAGRWPIVCSWPWLPMRRI